MKRTTSTRTTAQDESGDILGAVPEVTVLASARKTIAQTVVMVVVMLVRIWMVEMLVVVSPIEMAETETVEIGTVAASQERVAT